MLRNLSAVLIALTVVVSLATPAKASEDLRLLIDGVVVPTSPGAFVPRDMLIMIPLRATAETLGYTVDYETTTETVTMKRGPVIIQVRLNSDYISINGIEAKTTLPTIIRDGRAFMWLEDIDVLGVNGRLTENGVSLHRVVLYPDAEAVAAAVSRLCDLKILKFCTPL